MKTEAPWYWSDPECDHWAVTLVACFEEAEDDGPIHYAAHYERATACGQTSHALRLAEKPMVVTCRGCAKVARERRNQIRQRIVSPILRHRSRINWIRREQERNPAWLTPKEWDV